MQAACRTGRVKSSFTWRRKPEIPHHVSCLRLATWNFCLTIVLCPGEMLKCLGAPPPISFQIRHIAIENLRIILRVYVVYIACDLTRIQKYYLGNVPRENSLPFDALNLQN